MDGITRLIAVSQMKANNANNDAIAGANQQHALLQQQRSIRQAHDRRSSMYGDTSPTVSYVSWYSRFPW